MITDTPEDLPGTSGNMDDFKRAAAEMTEEENTEE
jgi:hypothetical protein